VQEEKTTILIIEKKRGNFSRFFCFVILSNYLCADDLIDCVVSFGKIGLRKEAASIRGFFLCFFAE
jgi:hypothetical protein